MPYHVVKEEYLQRLDGLLARAQYGDAQELVRQLLTIPCVSDGGNQEDSTSMEASYTLYIAAAMSRYVRGAGGYAYLLISPEGTLYEESNSKKSTYLYQMELEALAAALRNAPEGAAVQLFSTSEYVVNMFAKGWLKKWECEGWKKGDGSRPNLALLKEIHRRCAAITAEMPAESDDLAKLCQQKAQTAIQTAGKRYKHSLIPISEKFRG